MYVCMYVCIYVNKHTATYHSTMSFFQERTQEASFSVVISYLIHINIF